MRQRAAPRRTFLFLQGPHGCLFPKLGEALAAAGCQVRRINFNGGDYASWPSGVAFRGHDSAWPDFISRFIASEGVTDLVLFGDNRPLHAVAITAARAAGVCVHVFEEGYIRSDWVTLERDGVNGNSRLPRDASWFVRRAGALPPRPSDRPVPSFASARSWAAFFYYAQVVLQHWRFPLHSSHRPFDPVWEGVRWARRFGRKSRETLRSDLSEARLARRPYFLFPLQLDSDYQIRRHSPFGGMQAAIDHVLTSFARSAPKNMLLAVKQHPLDSGIKNWRSIVATIAGRLGIGERVILLEHGDLGSLVQRASGMVVVNSTSGTLALAAGKPVKVLGDAVYNLDGITDQAPLEAFWTSPAPPCAETYDAFCKVLARHCLVNGSFLNDIGIEMVIEGAVARLLSPEEFDVIGDAPAQGAVLAASDAARNPA